MPSSSVSGPARIRAKPTLHPRQPIQGIPSETVVVNPRSSGKQTFIENPRLLPSGLLGHGL